MFPKNNKRGGGAGIGRVLSIASITAQQGSIFNRYVPGAGVGATGVSVRRAKLYRAQNRGGPTVRVPDAPTGIIAVGYDTFATVRFTPPTENGGDTIVSYTVTSIPDGITATGTSSPIDVTGLTNGIAYTFIVVATNRAGNSASSAESNSVTPLYIPTIPDPPTSIVVSDKTLTTITLTFTQSSNGSPAISNYSYSLDGEPFVDLSPTDSTSPITISGLSSNTTYVISLKAKNVNGYSDPSEDITESTYATVNYARFTDVGAATWTPPEGVTRVEYLVVGGGGGGGGTYSKINVLGNVLVTDTPQAGAYWINSADLTNGRYKGRMYYGYNSGQNSSSFSDPIQLTASENLSPTLNSYAYNRWYNFELVYSLSSALQTVTNVAYTTGITTTYSNNISAGSGGGGGGQIKTSAAYPFSKHTVTPGTTYNIYVGGGGAGGTAGTNTESNGTDGEQSYFDTIVSTGGAGGKNSRTGFNQNGGGGFAYGNIIGGKGGASGGRNGAGVGNSQSYQTNTNVLIGTSGATGTSVNIDGTGNVVYGSGGDGGDANTVATSITPSNVGKGGEGTGSTLNSYAAGRDGGSGIVVIKYYT